MYVVLSLLYWLRIAYGVVRVRRDVPVLGNLQPPEPEAWPKLSVVVPACDEADKIEPAIRSLQAQDYPDLEIVLVDDRSTDGTGAIMDRLASGDERVRIIHVAELPDGWLGKVNALHRGFSAAEGELVLFTDADVHFSPGVLRKAVAWFVDRKLDHLAALPDIWPAGLVVDSLIAAFLRQLLTLLTPPWRAVDPNSGGFLGVGAFNLVRRSAFEATEGFEWLRMEVADDMGLAMMMKRSGAKCGVVAAFGDVGLHWYRGVAEAFRGAEKGYATTAGCRAGPILASVPVLAALEMAPVLAPLPLLLGRADAVAWCGLAVFALFAFSCTGLSRWARAGILPGLLTPLTAPISSAAMIRTAWLGFRRGGVAWRGTVYPGRLLREGRRIRLRPGAGRRTRGRAADKPASPAGRRR